MIIKKKKIFISLTNNIAINTNNQEGCACCCNGLEPSVKVAFI